MESDHQICTSRTKLEILPPYMTPFTSSVATSKIKAMKIFGTVKLELLNTVEPSALKKRGKLSSVGGARAAAMARKAQDPSGDGSEDNGTCLPPNGDGSNSPAFLYKELCKYQQKAKKQYGSRLSIKLKSRLIKRAINFVEY